MNVNSSSGESYICKGVPEPMTIDGAAGRRDWDERLARRTHALGASEITAILSLAGATDIIAFSGGFPEPGTFSTGLRDYVSQRLAAAEGRRPEAGELLITSGGIDCMELLAKSYLDPGDVVVVESPTYLGAIMAFRGYEADVRGVPLDESGRQVEALADRLAEGL